MADCIDCGYDIDSIGRDKHDPTRCSDCAAAYRDENQLSQCCAAPLENVEIGHSEREGVIYADYYVCEHCGKRTDED